MSEDALPLLVEPAWLEPRLREPGLTIVDASWYLPDEGRDARAEYGSAHVPGAIYLDLSLDLADPDAPVRNTLAPPQALAASFGRAGIGDADHVIVYDHRGGYSAGRVWWALRTVGHERVSLVDGGFGRWRAEGRPIASGVETRAPTRFEAKPDPSWCRSKEAVLAAVKDGGVSIVDARGAARFRGEGVEHTRHKGHIPGSINVPWSDHLCGEPAVLRPLAELRQHYERAGVSFERPVIASCGSGVTASLTAFVLTLLGHPQVAVYDGSWAEWGDADDVPIERGP